MLQNAMKLLNERERRILIERRLRDRPVKLAELSQQFGVSGERVRQIEERAFEKLRVSIHEAVRE